MKTISILITCILFFSLNYANAKEANSDLVIANGKMPNITRDKNNNIHLVYGTGDSVMYAMSKNGKSFTPPALIAVLPGVFASAMRGPQIAATNDGVVVTACTKKGNIYSYRKGSTGNWSKPMKVNDIDENAKEALMGLSADGLNVFAVWLGVKSPKGQSLYGAKSIDGGKTWSKNMVVYASPESTICECCKPSVAVKGNIVYAMFRNFLQGNRDLYLVKSSDAGKSFERAQKLGEGSWKLNGCPMDGGGLALGTGDIAETVWRREGKIYASKAGSPEKEIGEGRGCTIETINGKKVYAWAQNGNVIVMNSGGIKKDLGKGSLPLVKALSGEHGICVWENENQIHAAIVEL